MRRLVTPAKRIILSNVNLCIPHDILETEIQRIGYKLASPMNFLRAGIPGEEVFVANYTYSLMKLLNCLIS